MKNYNSIRHLRGRYKFSWFQDLSVGKRQLKCTYSFPLKRTWEFSPHWLLMSQHKDIGAAFPTPARFQLQQVDGMGRVTSPPITLLTVKQLPGHSRIKFSSTEGKTVSRFKNTTKAVVRRAWKLMGNLSIDLSLAVIFMVWEVFLCELSITFACPVDILGYTNTLASAGLQACVATTSSLPPLLLLKLITSWSLVCDLLFCPCWCQPLNSGGEVMGGERVSRETLFT